MVTYNEAARALINEQVLHREAKTMSDKFAALLVKVSRFVLELIPVLLLTPH